MRNLEDLEQENRTGRRGQSLSVERTQDRMTLAELRVRTRHGSVSLCQSAWSAIDAVDGSQKDRMDAVEEADEYVRADRSKFWTKKVDQHTCFSSHQVK